MIDVSWPLYDKPLAGDFECYQDISSVDQDKHRAVTSVSTMFHPRHMPEVWAEKLEELPLAQRTQIAPKKAALARASLSQSFGSLRTWSVLPQRGRRRTELRDSRKAYPKEVRTLGKPFQYVNNLALRSGTHTRDM